MQTPDAERLEEIRRILPERARLAESLAALDRRIAELAGAEPPGGSHKPPRKAMPRDLFRAGCGV